MKELEFLQSAGIPVVTDDMVGYQRAKEFTRSIGLIWNQEWFVYGGKVYVKPENKDETL